MGATWAHFFCSMAVPNPLESHQVVAQVQALVEPLLAARHVELVELTYRREGPQVVLRFLVDTAMGITVEECRRLNQGIGAVLDEHEVLRNQYTLEVASPGLDRPLKTVWDFERVIGRRVWMELREPVVGGAGRELVGTVAGVGDEVVSVTLDHGEKVRVLLAMIVRARQDISFRKGD